ncbi:MAG: hypothetical protein IJF39_01510 [Clostridia bacterium]|nr:hypothetical protein [Clostridia bacterium]
MELMDFDGLFDEKLALYMEEKKDKYTEKEWEDVIPRLYKKFGDTYVAKVKCTPKEYYARMTDEQLVQTLSAHLLQDVPVSEFLCNELENRNNVELLLPLLESDDTATQSYAINLILDDKRAYDAYFSLLCNEAADEDVRDDVAEIFKHNADEVVDKVLAAYRAGIATEYMLEIMSRVVGRLEEVFAILRDEFLSAGERTPMRASYLAAYGDVRALPLLMQKIEDRSIGFVEFQELKYAIEALGGEYDEPRDFSEDKDYLAVEAATAKALAKPEMKS